MRELKTTELNEVSGAGWITDIGTAFGQGIGSILEAAGVKGGMESSVTMGTGIGQIVEASINSITAILGGLFGKKS